ncbi:N-acetyltransferase family protein [Ideonella azotifigens]|uniref:GNAT family N-acetyltransferase n=1 Tax=Ideonella azotifigens TaxID=513160 RepID=A0ABN1K7Q2_9BURK|nr:GNAT family N-acetyltransferase [Ideonella azotifigens]MCD2342183.1 N-acetyltransferase family protein [Ideonella azotifigens]
MSHHAIRPAAHSDIDALRVLRNHYVANSFATFDEVLLSEQDMRSWLAVFDPGSPHQLWLAMDGDQLLGCACSQPYRAHPAFRFTIETSIYVAPGQTGRRHGEQLYQTLFAFLAPHELRKAVVGIALPNEASLALHRKLGFTEVGTFHDYAVKHGRSIRSMWMERDLA